LNIIEQEHIHCGKELVLACSKVELPKIHPLQEKQPEVRNIFLFKT